MRNPLKRSADLAPSFRERLAGYRDRLAAAKAKAGQVMAVNRVLLAPPAPEPAVDRAALMNYATFLWRERRAVCAELYPHMGRKADQFVLSNNEADRFFIVSEGNRAERRDQPPASSRAVRILDLVGIDWRKDGSDEDIARRYGSGLVDDGKRPALPHGWPAPDAALLEALGDLRRLDLAIDALGTYAADDRRELGDLPAWDDLESHRNGALQRLANEQSESAIGLQAKARAILTPSLQGIQGATDDLAESLARDLLGLGQRAVDPQPDPAFAVVEEARRLMAVYDAAVDISARLPDSDPSHDVTSEASDAMWAHVDDVVLNTVPRTAEGCKVLARFADDFVKRQGVSMLRGDDGSNPDPVLALIARSPLL